MYNKKHILYKEGQRPRVVYHVISGKVKVSKTNQDGKEFITNIYGPGDFFGYTAILKDENYKDEAEILEETKLMHIPTEDFYATDIKRYADCAKLYKNNNSKYC
ncbi:MAG: cyclic nucleotide-binding domain-containing protein [Segetibacter sp.]